jgi:hypothetical protein
MPLSSGHLLERYQAVQAPELHDDTWNWDMFGSTQAQSSSTQAQSSSTSHGVSGQFQSAPAQLALLGSEVSPASPLGVSGAMQTGQSLLGQSLQLARRKVNYEPGRDQMAEEQRIANIKPLSLEQKQRGLARAAKPLAARTASHWNKDEVLFSLDHKIEQYAWRHGGQRALTKDRRQRSDQGGVRQKELAILDKMKKDEEAGALKLPVEQACDDALRTGLREYVDYAVDEVERFNKISKTGQVTAAFDWSACGDFHDVPSLRRSCGINRVDGAPSHIVGLGQGSDDMFTMDFLRDFCARSNEEPPEDFTLARMGATARSMWEPPLFRADNGAPILEKELPSLEEHHVGFPGHGDNDTFRDREWAVEYSVV